ncbi:hypothetical protein Tco_0049205, partial [Tanacetum coccineum]
INMARELVEQAVQGRATRIGESNKRKWYKRLKTKQKWPRGTTQVVTRGTTNHWYENVRWQVRGTVHPRWQYEVAAAGQSEHDTCPKRVIRGCQACVSPRLSCGDPRQ